MALPVIPPKAVVRGPFLPEPVEVIVTVPMDDSLKLIGRGLNTGMSYDPVLSPTQLTELEVSPEREHLIELVERKLWKRALAEGVVKAAQHRFSGGFVPHTLTILRTGDRRCLK